jgi:hypothetical protein
MVEELIAQVSTTLHLPWVTDFCLRSSRRGRGLPGPHVLKPGSGGPHPRRRR